MAMKIETLRIEDAHIITRCSSDCCRNGRPELKIPLSATEEGSIRAPFLNKDLGDNAYVDLSGAVYCSRECYSRVCED